HAGNVVRAAGELLLEPSLDFFFGILALRKDDGDRRYHFRAVGENRYGKRTDALHIFRGGDREAADADEIEQIVEVLAVGDRRRRIGGQPEVIQHLVAGWLIEEREH